jgi:hypothetical protein
MCTRAAILVMLCLPMQMAAQVGLLSKISGKVEIRRPGEDAMVTAKLADFIEAGSRVRTGARSETVFLFCPERRSARILQNSEVEFQAGKFTVLKGTIRDERDLPTCRLPEGLVLTSASRLQSGMLRMRGFELALISPSHTSVSSLQPVFRWSPLDDASQYELQLMDQDRNVLWSHKGPATQAKFPADGPALSWGEKYWWRVKALNDTGTVGESDSDFQVLTMQQAEAVRDSGSALRRSIGENPKDAGPLMLLAFLYEEYGMLDQAVPLLEELAQEPEAQEWVGVHLKELMGRLGWQSVDPKLRQ